MDDKTKPPDAHRLNVSALESTVELLQLARDGNSHALDRLYGRYLPRLRRWAAGRLPPGARDLLETDDLVQEVLTRTVRRADQLELRSAGEFHCYLRRSLTNRLLDEVRRAKRRPEGEEFVDDHEDAGPSPIEELLGKEQIERYEAALERLRPEDREAIVARIEMSSTYAEIADVLGKPSADAARMAVTRAIVRLAEEIRRHE
jgi:RNA polymerase sigma-70 factor (ECF subfamily)